MDDDWQPLLDKQGKPVENQETCRIPHWIGNDDKPFTLVIQRKRLKGQVTLDLEADTINEEIVSQGYLYRARS